MYNKVENAESQGILNQLIDDLYNISKEIKNEEVIKNYSNVKLKYLFLLKRVDYKRMWMDFGH